MEWAEERLPQAFVRTDLVPDEEAPLPVEVFSRQGKRFVRLTISDAPELAVLLLR